MQRFPRCPGARSFDEICMSRVRYLVYILFPIMDGMQIIRIKFELFMQIIIKRNKMYFKHYGYFSAKKFNCPFSSHLL